MNTAPAQTLPFAGQEARALPQSYGTMNVPVTDDLIEALEDALSRVLPTRFATELLCLKVQALIMRNRVTAVSADSVAS